MTARGADTLLAVERLRVRIGSADVLSDVSLSCGRGEVLALAGESGCGKSLTALAVMGLLPPAARVVSGSVRLGDLELTGLSERALRELRGREIGMVFQDPSTAFNPMLSIGRHVEEALLLHVPLGRAETRRRVVESLARVGIPEPERRAGQYPHQFSGGMLQRAMIAVATVAGPGLLIADEPTTALDVTVQAQIVELLRTLKAREGLSVLFISHDLGVVARLADRVAIMYAGRIVETAPVGRFFKAPAHPYSRGLIASVPRLGRSPERLPGIPGRVPAAGDAPPGCAFAPRCTHAEPACSGAVPEVVRLGETLVACRRAGEI